VSSSQRRRDIPDAGPVGIVVPCGHEQRPVLGFIGLCFALDDPCSGVSGCEPIVDTQTGGREMAVVALLIGVAAAWMVYRGREFPDDG
jgi:hypothetical protein